MKKIILIAAFFLMAGCDGQKSAVVVNSSHEERKSSESAKFECQKGSISTECNITSGDQMGSGKWRHAVLNISRRDVSLKMDGESFYRTDFDSGFYDGDQVTTIYLKGMKGNKAEVSIHQSNKGSYIILNVKNSNDKLLLTASN